MAATNGSEARQALKGGVTAGVIGGVVLTVFLVLMNVIRGDDLWAPFKVSAYPFLGELVLRDGPAVLPMVLGTLTHLAVSIGWGILFGVLFYGLSKPATLAVSLLWGIVVWAVMFFAVLPLVGAGALVRGPMAVPILEHLLFGLSLGLGFLPFQRTRPRTVTHHVPITQT